MIKQERSAFIGLRVEFNFANKRAECIGQALYYIIITNKIPVCILIMKNGQSDLKYLKRLKTTARKYNIAVITMIPEKICSGK